MDYHIRSWTRPFLKFAAVYHILWGLFLISFPGLLFEWASLPLPTYPILMQGVGGVVLIFGMAYLISSQDVFRHWLVVLMAFLLKFAAFAATILYFLQGTLGEDFVVFSFVNDLLWLPVLGWILHQVFLQHESQQYYPDRRKLKITGDILETAEDQYGTSLANISYHRPVLLVFLRQFGCTFCREAMADLASKREEIEASGSRLILVHMSPTERADEFFEQYGMKDVSRISDEERQLYQAFGLPRGSFQQMFGWKSWLRILFAGIVKGHWVGRIESDGWQLPGAFLIYRDEVIQSFRHQTPSDRPDYISLATCEVCG